MNDEQIARMTKWKLLGLNSCALCRFLYLQDRGYSNYTVTDTDVICALGRNPNLPADEPYDWKWNHEGRDNWPKTNQSRCERFDERANYGMFRLDVDGEVTIEECGDSELIDAVNHNPQHN